MRSISVRGSLLGVASIAIAVYGTDMKRPVKVALIPSLHSFSSLKREQAAAEDSEMRRLITLIFAGRDRMVVIRGVANVIRSAGRRDGKLSRHATRLGLVGGLT